MCVSSFLFLSFPFLVRMSSNNFIQVAEEEGDEPIELPTEEADNSLLITTLAAQFPGACGLKYRNPESRAWRGVRLSDGRLFPPLDTGWGGHVYISVMPKGKKDQKNSLFFEARREKDPSIKDIILFLGFVSIFSINNISVCSNAFVHGTALTTMKSDI